MKHEIACLRKLHGYSKKYPCNCFDGSDEDKNFRIDREAEYLMSGYGKKEAKVKALHDFYKSSENNGK